MTCCDFLISTPWEKTGRSVVIGFVVASLLSVQPFGQANANPVQNRSPATIDHEDSSGSSWQLLSTICNQIMEHHISPPTRQQLYLSGVKAIYVANRVAPPSELGEQFSKLTTEEDFEKAVTAAWGEVAKLPNFDAGQTSRAAAAGMVRNGTPSSRYVSAKDYRVQKQLKENQYVGIGIQLKYETGLPQITEAFFGGAAHMAGARAGDWILEVDGWKTRDQLFQEAIDRLRGPKGSKVIVVVRHKDAVETDQRTYEMIRNVIPLATVQGHDRRDDGTWNLAAADGGTVAILKFMSIVGSTAAEAAELARQVDYESFQSVILDFRGINTADLHSVTMLADVLLGDVKLGDIVGRESTSTVRLRPDMHLRDMPMVILSDSAVSGELFMLLSALREHRGARFVGEAIRSDAMCMKAVELPGDLGTIDNLAYATCAPAAKSTAETGFELFGEEMVTNGRLLIPADIAESGGPLEVMKTAIQTAEKAIAGTAKTKQSEGNRP
jgi:C-terminal processing protease CtpA/Prc